MYKFHTPAEYHQLILDTEREIEEQSRLEQVRRWAADPANAAQLAHIRAELDRVAPRPQQRPAAPTSTVRTAQGTLPEIIPADAHFKPSDLKLRPANRVDSITDPLVMSPGATIRQR